MKKLETRLKSMAAMVLLLLSLSAVAVDIGVSITTTPVNLSTYQPGSSQSNAYSVVIAKTTGSADITDIKVVSEFTGSNNEVSSLTWTCTAAGSSVCNAAGGTTGNESFEADLDLIGDDTVTLLVTNVTFNSNLIVDLAFETEITDFGMNGAANNADSTSANDSDSVNLDRDSLTNLSVSLTDGSQTYTPGTSASYTLLIANAGPSFANNIAVSQSALPSGLTITGWECTTVSQGSCSPSDNSGNLALSLDLDASGQAEIVINGSYASSSITNPLVYTVQTALTDSAATGTSPNASDSNQLQLESILTLSVNTQAPLETQYTPGASETFIVVVSNTGPSDVTGLNIEDNDPARFENISWTCENEDTSACSAASGSGNLDTPVDIKANSFVTFSIDVDYDPAFTDPLTTPNLVYSVTATNPPLVNGTTAVSDSKSLSLNLVSNLVLTVTDSMAIYTPGLNGTFIAVLSNNGPSDVNGVTVVDNDLTEYASTAWVCSVNDANSDCPNGTINLPINTSVDIAAGDNVSFTVTASYASSTFVNPLVYEVTATNPSGVSGTTAITTADQEANILQRQVNLSISKTGKVGSVVPNEPFTYSILVANSGPSDLGAAVDDMGNSTESGVLLRDLFDSTLTNNPTLCGVGATEPCWEFCSSDDGITNSTLSPDPQDCPGGEISSDSGPELSIPVRLSAGSSSEIRVHARIGVSSGSDCDINTSATNEVCNTASLTLEDDFTTNIGTQFPLIDGHTNEIVIGTDLVVEKTDGVNSAAPGTEISYSILVTNNGFIDAQGVLVEDILPVFTGSGAGFDAGSISWRCQTNDNNACCNSQSTACGLNAPTTPIFSDQLNATVDLGSLSEVVFTVTGTIASNATGTLVNMAEATLPNGIMETDPSNNSDLDDDTVLTSFSDISVTKNLELASINAIDETVTDFEYLIEVTNLGPSLAVGIDVIDVLNSDAYLLSTASWSCAVTGSGSCQETGIVTGSPINTQVDLAVGASAVFTLNISTKSGAMGTVVNVVNVTPNGFDPVQINNTDSVEYTLSGTAQLTIDIDDSLMETTPGLPTSYEVKVTNEGPDNVFGASVQSLFPPELTDIQWTCSAISPIPGDLTFLQSSDQSAVGQVMFLSHDGSHVYIASPDTDGMSPFSSSIDIFARNTIPGAQFGQLSFVGDISQVDGIEKIQTFASDSNGQYLYALSDVFVGSTSVPAVSIFSRITNPLSPSFGELMFLGVMSDNIPSDPVDMLLSSDGKHMYVSGNDSIQRYSRDVGTGFLTHEASEVAVDAGSLVQSSGGDQLYVISHTGSEANSYVRDNDNMSATFGSLTALNTVSNADISSSQDAVISDDGMNLYITAAGSNKVIVIDRNIGTGMLSFSTSYDDSDLGLNVLVDPADTLVGLSQLAISEDGQHVFITNPIQSTVLVLGRNSQGLLNKKEKISRTGMEGVSDVVVSRPDGKHVLVTAAGTGGKTLTAFNRRQPDPAFAFIEAELDGQNGVDGLLGASAVVVSDDGNHVYTTGIGDNALAVFVRDPTKGSTAADTAEHLTFLTSYEEGDPDVSGLEDVNSLQLTPNGNFLFVGSSDQATLAVFSRAADGLLTHVSTYQHAANTNDGLLGISGFAVDSSSQHLYVAGRFEASVAHYTIDAGGFLTLQNAVANGDVGVSGLAGAREIEISPDEKHLVVASSIDDSVVVLSRNLFTGSIGFQQRISTVGDQPMDLVISPDGEHVYVVSANDSRLTLLKRITNEAQSEFGNLSLITSYLDGASGFNQLNGARAVAISGNGEKVYVGAEFDAAITILDRDQNPNSASFGQLAVIEARVDDVDGINGLNQLYDLTVSKDNRHVYAVGFGDNAVAAFVLGVGSSCSAQGSGNILDVVDVGSNGTLTYNINAKIRSSATGDLVTEARLMKPDNFAIIAPVDQCLNAPVTAVDNCAQDSTLLIPVTDLSITKTNGKLSAVAGEPIQYEIVVNNLGPSDAISSVNERVMVKDVLNSDFISNSITWTCEAIGSGSLTFLQSVIDGVQNAEGLKGISAIKYSPDLAGLGPYVLATSVIDNGLLAFKVNPTNGNLTQTLQAGTFVTATTTINLAGARDVLIIDDYVYVASQVDDSLVVFRAVDSGGLALQWMANHDFSDGISGLNQAVAVTASDDGAHVYVAGANDNSVVIFSRNMVNGGLTYSTTLTQSGQGLSGVNALAVSKDGFSAYTSGFNTNELGVYKRDPLTGDLTFSSVLSIPGVLFSNISSVNVSADDQQLYVTSAGNNRLYVFQRDTSVSTTSTAYGSLTLLQKIEQNVGGVVGFLQPSDVQGSADLRHVYVSTQQSDAVVWLVRDLGTGLLTFGGLISDIVADVDGLNGAISVTISENGNYVYVAGSLDNGIAVLSRVSDSFCPAAGTGNIAIDDNGIEAGVAVDLAVNGSLKFTLNATVAPDASGDQSGKLNNTASVYNCELPLVAPLENCNTADPKSSNNNDTDSDDLSPTADLMITKSDGISQYSGLNGATQVVGDNKHVYVAARQDNAISVFKRQDNSGEANYGGLTYLYNVVNGFDGVSGLLAVSDLILSDDGLTLYAAGSGDNSVVAFKRNINDGSLTFVEKYSSGVFGVTGIEGVAALSLSGDGAHLYATGPLTNSMSVFSVNQSSGVDKGKLTFEQQLQNGIGGVGGLANVNDVIANSEGNHVYVTSETGNSVSLFLRNPNQASITFGQLSYITSYTNGVDGVAGLAGASAMQFAGDYLYVLGGVDQALVVFSREPSSGELTFVEFKQNGTSNVVGLNLARDLFVSQDQMNIYVAGFQENVIVKFNRDSIEGTLVFGNSISDGDPLGLPGEFVNGLNHAAGLFVSADDSHLYVVAEGDDSVAIFSRNSTSQLPDLGDLLQTDVLINGRGGVAPGSELTYLITVSNAGPSNVEKARIVDIFPPQFEGISYQCFPVNGAACDTSIKSGNVDELVDMLPGSRVEIRATGVVRADAAGTLVNTATVASSTNPNFAISDPDLTNNTATDDDTILFVATDLVVTKENGLNEIVPGTPVNYIITVANDSVLPGNSIPASVKGVLVTDEVPESISNVAWTCQAFPQPGLLDDGDGDNQTSNFIAYTDLDLFIDMVINQSGETAYVAGIDAGIYTLVKYQRDSRTGALQETQRINENTTGQFGLAGVQSLLLSADEKQLYAVSDIDDAIVTFEIEVVTGDLNFVDAQFDGLNGVNGLGGAIDLILSVDGRHLYVAGKLDNAIAIFNRNVATGVLTFNDVLTGVEGLSGVQSMTFNNTGEYLLVVAEANNSLAVFTRTAVNGLLVSSDVIQNFQLADSVLESPRDVVVKQNKIFVASYLSDAIAVFDLNVDDGSLSFAYYVKDGEAGISGLQGVESLVIGPLNEELYAGSGLSETITLFTQLDQQLEQVNTFYDTDIIPELDMVTQLIIDPNGVHLYALSDELVLTKRLNGSKCSSAGFGNLNDVADISSGGSVIYSLSGDVAATASGTLSNSASAIMKGDATELVPGDNTATDVDLLTPLSDLSITKTDGLLSVVAGTEVIYDMGVFSAGPSALNVTVEDMVPIFPTTQAGFESGSVAWACNSGNTIQFNQSYSGDLLNGLVDVTDAVKTTDGQFVYFISENGSVAVYASDTSGVLTFVSMVIDGDVNGSGTVSGLLGASAIIIDQENDFIYVASQDANSIVVFARDAVNGALNYIETIVSSVNGVIGMSGPVALSITPDNKGLYVAANNSDAITVFTRDVLTGQLSFVERVRDGFGTIVPESNVILEITNLVISPDGKYLYSVADFSESIAVFEIDPDDYKLTFLSVTRAGDENNGLTVPSMLGLNHVILSKNGNFMYVTTKDQGSIMRFRRSTLTGALEFEESLVSGDLGVGSLSKPSSIKLTPSGTQLFVTDSDTVTVSLYDRNLNTGELNLLEEYVYDHVIPAGETLNLINDGLNVLVMYKNIDLVETLRVTSSAVCGVESGNTDVLSLPIYMTPAAAADLQLIGLVHPSARGTLTNVADIIAESGAIDSNLINNTDFDDTTITIETDVALVKAGPENVIAGDSIGYELRLTNAGPSDALGVVVNDIFANELFNITWNCSATGRSVCSTNSGTGNLNLPVDVGADGEVVIAISATVSPAFAGVLSNSAAAVVFEGGFNTDQNLLNNTDQLDTTVTQEPDLSVLKSNGMNVVIAGEQLSYQIVINNNGPSDSPGTIVLDTMPTVLQNVTWTCVTDPGTFCTSAGTGDISEVTYLAAGTQLTYQVNALLSSAAQGQLTNQVTVATSAPVVDPNASNNVAVDSDPIEQISDMTVILEDLIDPYDPASNTDLPFYLRVENLGPSDAENVIVDLPLQLDVTADVINVCDVVGATLNCDIGYSSAGQVNEIIVNYRLNPALTGQVENLAEVSTTTFESDLNNNMATTTTDLANGVDIRVSKSDGVEHVEPGEQVEYMIVIENIGSVDSGEVTINEMMPFELINATWTCTEFEGATCLNIDNNITGGADLPAGSRVELRLTATVDPSLVNMTVATVTNTVEVVLISEVDFNNLNNIDSDTDVLIFFIFKDGFEGVIP